MDNYRMLDEAGGSAEPYISNEEARDAVYTLVKYVKEHKREVLAIVTTTILASSFWAPLVTVGA